jgi:ATP-dependent DNA helicase RecG
MISAAMSLTVHNHVDKDSMLHPIRRSPTSRRDRSHQRPLTNFQLKQREMICLGLLAQAEHMTARQLAQVLMLENVEAVRPWLGRLLDLGLVKSTGRTQATQYFVTPDVKRTLDAPTTTTLGRIEPHRLQALIEEDLARYPRSKLGSIRARIGPEIASHTIRRAIDVLLEKGTIKGEGSTNARVYWLAN